MTEQTERLETVKVKLPVKLRLDELQYKAKMQGRRVTQSELIEEMIERAEGKAPSDAIDAGLTAKQKDQVRLFVECLRSTPQHDLLKRARNGVLDDLALWQLVRAELDPNL